MALLSTTDSLSPNTSELKAHVAEGKVEVKSLFGHGACGDKFGATGGSLTSVLFLGAPVNNGLIEEADNARDGATIKEIMMKVGIDVHGGDDGMAEWTRKVGRDFFSDIASQVGVPLTCSGVKGGVIRKTSVAAKGTASHLTQGLKGCGHHRVLLRQVPGDCALVVTHVISIDGSMT